MHDACTDLFAIHTDRAVSWSFAAAHPHRLRYFDTQNDFTSESAFSMALARRVHSKAVRGSAMTALLETARNVQKGLLASQHL